MTDLKEYHEVVNTNYKKFKKHLENPPKDDAEFKAMIKDFKTGYNGSMLFADLANAFMAEIERVSNG